jgi:hypothetical protein
MLAVPVPILPVSSVHLHGPAVIPPAVIPNDDQFPSLRQFCAHWVASEASEVSFCDRPHEVVASPVQALVTGFRIDSNPNVPAHTSVPRKPLSAMPSSYVRHLCRKSRWNTLPQNERRKSSRMRTYTKRGEGGATLFRTQSTSFFVSLEPRCHNGLLWGCDSIYPQSLRRRRRHGQS